MRIIDSIGNENAELYISARLTSQGSQETYSYNPDEDDALSAEELSAEEEEEEEDKVENKLLTSFNNNNNKNNMLRSPYTTPRQAKLMRDISSTNYT